MALIIHFDASVCEIFLIAHILKYYRLSINSAVIKQLIEETYYM